MGGKKKPERKQKENLSIPEQFNKSEANLIFSFQKKREATTGPHEEASSAPHLASLCSSQAAKGQTNITWDEKCGKQIVLHYLTGHGNRTTVLSTATDSCVTGSKPHTLALDL